MDEQQREVYWMSVVMPGIDMLKREYSFDFGPIVYSLYYQMNFGSHTIELCLDAQANKFKINADQGQITGSDRIHPVKDVQSPEQFASLIRGYVPPIITEFARALTRCRADDRVEVTPNQAVIGHVMIRNKQNNACANVFVMKDEIITKIIGAVALTVLEKQTIEIMTVNKRDIAYHHLLASIGLGPP